MMHKFVAATVLSGCLMPAVSQAHFFAEAHNCKAPVKPLEFITELDKQTFDQEVDLYRDCLQTFVDKQNQSMSKHQSAAKQAADTWSNYAQNVLGMKLNKATDSNQ